MNYFLATTGTRLVQAVCDGGEQWRVDVVLEQPAVTCLAADGLQSGVVYAGTIGQGVWRSTDYGKTWRAVGLAGQTVKALAASRLEPGVLYAGTKPALVFVSRDHGRRWEELTGFRKIFSRRFWFSPAEPPYRAYVQSLVLSPVDANVIIAGIEFGAVVCSWDGGNTWTDHRKGALRDCHMLAFHPLDGSRVYEAGGTGAGAATSRDGGHTWTQPRAGLDRHYGWACTADPYQPDRWYISAAPSPGKAHVAGKAEAYIYRSTPGGGWERLSGGLPQPLRHMPYALLADPAEPGCLYAGLANGELWRSQDQGDTWRQLPVKLQGVQHTMILYS